MAAKKQGTNVKQGKQIQAGKLQRGVLQRGTLQRGMLQRGTLQRGTLQRGTLQRGTLQPGSGFEGYHSPRKQHLPQKPVGCRTKRQPTLISSGGRLTTPASGTRARPCAPPATPQGG